MAANSYKFSKFKEEYPKLTPLLVGFLPNPIVLLVYFCSNFEDSDDFSQFLEKLSGFNLEDQLKVILFREDDKKIPDLSKFNDISDFILKNTFGRVCLSIYE